MSDLALSTTSGPGSNPSSVAALKANRNTHPKFSNAYSQALEIQSALLGRMRNPKATDAALAVLARSWCLVQEQVRIIRGLPLPGQLRPDLDPVQLVKALKRHKQRIPDKFGIIDVTKGFDEAPPSQEPEQPQRTTTLRQAAEQSPAASTPEPGKPPTDTKGIY